MAGTAPKADPTQGPAFAIQAGRSRLVRDRVRQWPSLAAAAPAASDPWRRERPAASESSRG